MRLARGNIKRRRRVLKAIKRYGRDAEQSHKSWRGYALKCNAYRSVNNLDRLYNELFIKENNNDTARLEQDNGGA